MAKKLTIKFKIRKYQKTDYFYAVYCHLTYNRKTTSFQVPSVGVSGKSEKAAQEKLDNMVLDLNNFNGSFLRDIVKLLEYEKNNNPEKFTITGFPKRLKKYSEKVLNLLTSRIARDLDNSNFDFLDHPQNQFVFHFRISVLKLTATRVLNEGNESEIFADFLYGLNQSILLYKVDTLKAIKNVNILIVIGIYWLAFEHSKRMEYYKTTFKRPKLEDPFIRMQSFLIEIEGSEKRKYLEIFSGFTEVRKLKGLIPGIEKLLKVLLERTNAAPDILQEKFNEFIESQGG